MDYARVKEILVILWLENFHISIEGLTKNTFANMSAGGSRLCEDKVFFVFHQIPCLRSPQETHL